MRLLPISPSTHVLRSIICRPEPGLWRPAFSPIGEQNLALLDIVRSLPHANSFTHYSTPPDIIIIYVFDNHHHRTLSYLYSFFAGQCLRPKRIYPPAGPPIPLPDHPPRSAIGPCVACIARYCMRTRASSVFALCTNFFARLCQNMLQIILCYVEKICYIKNASYSLLCFKALKKFG